MTTENNYIKQFPDLMRGRKIMYVHGFGSSAQSGTVKRIRETLPGAEVIAYDMPLHPAEALDLLHKVCEEQRPDLIIGTSMGGMYAEMLYGFNRILVNPAFQMADTMKEHGMTGKQLWQNPRGDGEKEFLVTKALEKEYRETTEKSFSGITPEERQKVWGLFGDQDDVVHTYDLFCGHYPQAAHFHGGHRMDDKSFIHGVVPVIRWISDKLEKKERQTLFIALETLKDDYDKPRSSMLKAYEMLIETYNVYIVAPAPTNAPDSLNRTQDWVEKNLSTPAHDRLIFCNSLQLLLGDFLVSSRKVENFMGTQLEFGSDSFKTWEEVIIYFQRLSGQ